MNRFRRRLVPAAAAFVAGALISCSSAERPPGPAGASQPEAGASASIDLARAEAADFLERYVGTDGRVARIDQGGDTVSEGQAYAMLLAIVADDPATFERVWGWTRQNLRREDGLFSWHWDDGRVVDPQAASDADLGVAWALVLATQRFDRPAYEDEAARIADAILSVETMRLGGDRVLVAGPWAKTTPGVVNPSYLTPSAFAALADATGDATWTELARASLDLIGSLTNDAPHLPPDWSRVAGDGDVQASGAPGTGDAPRYGWDAVRVPLWLSASCEEDDRSIAARMWPFLRRAEKSSVASVYSLKGEPVQNDPSASALVAAAAAAYAAGSDESGRALLARAASMNERSPTYYGAALVAIGRALLETTLLASCER